MPIVIWMHAASTVLWNISSGCFPPLCAAVSFTTVFRPWLTLMDVSFSTSANIYQQLYFASIDASSYTKGHTAFQLHFNVSLTLCISQKTEKETISPCIGVGSYCTVRMIPGPGSLKLSLSLYIMIYRRNLNIFYLDEIIQFRIYRGEL